MAVRNHSFEFSVLRAAMSFVEAQSNQVIDISRRHAFDRIRRAVINFHFAVVFQYHPTRENNILPVTVLFFKSPVGSDKRLVIYADHL